jgi:hypothetical protein
MLPSMTSTPDPYTCSCGRKKLPAYPTCYQCLSDSIVIKAMMGKPMTQLENNLLNKGWREWKDSGTETTNSGSAIERMR